MSSHTDTQKYNNPLDLKGFEANSKNVVLTGFSLVVVVMLVCVCVCVCVSGEGGVEDPHYYLTLPKIAQMQKLRIRPSWYKKLGHPFRLKSVLSCGNLLARNMKN